MSPNRAYLLATNPLPGSLPVLDGGAVEQYAAIGRDHLGGDRRGISDESIPTPPRTAKEITNTNPRAIHNFS